MKYTIYIDTHFTNLVFGLFKDEKLIDEKKIESAEHSKNMIPAFQELLKENHITVDDIESIIVINGPGSFTGVRIGVVLAKILAFTKNIPVKALTYLEAMDLSYDKDVILGIKDRNGAFIGEFLKNHKLKKEYYYLTKEELANIDFAINYDDNIDLELVYQYMKNNNTVNPHLLKPIYVKKIDVGAHKNA